jgi:hypothetical protein
MQPTNEEAKHACPMCKGSGKVTNEQQYNFVDQIIGWYTRQQDKVTNQLHVYLDKLFTKERGNTR